MSGNARKLIHAQEAGFTLLEQLVVLSVASVMLAIVVPSMSRLYQHYELDTAANSTVLDLRQAQMSAWAHQDTQEVWFSRFKPQYTLWQNGAEWGQVVMPQRISYLNGYLDQVVSDLRFDQTGGIAGNGTVRLINQVKEEADIMVYLGNGIVDYDGVYSR